MTLLWNFGRLFDCQFALYEFLYVCIYLQIYKSNEKKNTFIDAGDTDSSNWLRYVNCGRAESEQNLKAFQFKGE